MLSPGRLFPALAHDANGNADGCQIGSIDCHYSNRRRAEASSKQKKIARERQANGKYLRAGSWGEQKKTRANFAAAFL